MFLFEYLIVIIFLAAVIFAFIFYNICIKSSSKNRIIYFDKYDFVKKDLSKTQLRDIPSIKIINQGCKRNVVSSSKNSGDSKHDDGSAANKTDSGLKIISKGCRTNIFPKPENCNDQMKEKSVPQTILHM